MNSHHIRTIARWLLAVMVFATLHPAVAAGWARQNGTQVEVCTSQGMRWVSIERQEATDPAAVSESSSEVHSEHCPLCRVLGDAITNPARTDLSFAAPRWLRHVAASVPRPLDTFRHVILTAPPRAPPLWT